MARKMKDSGIEWIGEIPEGWEVVPVKRLCTMQAGKNLTSEQIAPEGTYPVYGGNGIRGFFSDYNCDGQFLTVGRQGALCGNVHKINGKVWATEHAVITTPSSYAILDFLYFLLIGMDLNQYVSSTAAQPGLAVGTLLNLKTCYPCSTLEQTQISNYLNAKCSEIDVMLSKIRSSIEEYKKLKQAVITQAVTKGVRGEREMKDSGVEWIEKIPKEWKKNKILRIFSTIGSGTTPKSTDNNNFDGNINWLQSGDINGNILKECKNRISFKVLSKYPALKLYHAPFIIIAMYGASIGNLSISIIDGCVNQACCVFSHTSQNFQYMFYCLKTVQPYLIRKAVGGGQPNVSQEILKSLWVPLPPLDEQKEIANYLDAKCAEIDKLIAKKEQLVKELESYKKSLIYEVVTGKRKV